MTLTLWRITIWLAEERNQLWVQQRMQECSGSELHGRMQAGGWRQDWDRAYYYHYYDAALQFRVTLQHYFTEGEQVKWDVLAACCKIPLLITTCTTTDTASSSQEWWALSWPDREVSILKAKCPRRDARGMTLSRERARKEEEAEETSCLPPWCSSPTSCRGCCGKPTTARMSGGWRGSGRSRGSSGSRGWSKL